MLSAYVRKLRYTEIVRGRFKMLCSSGKPYRQVSNTLVTYIVRNCDSGHSVTTAYIDK